MNAQVLQLVRTGDLGESTIPIACRFAKAKADKPVFVWFCGFKSDMDSLKAAALADWAERNGAGCLRFDYSGHGKSGGRFEDGTIGLWLAQAAAVCSHALARGEAFVFAGSSMGGWIALLLARALKAKGQPVPKGILLIAPAWDMTRMMWDRASPEAREAIARDGVYLRPSAYSPEPYPITRHLIEEGNRHLIGKGPVNLDVPIRILHGCEDLDVPWQHSLELLEIVTGRDLRLTLVKDGEHRLSRPSDLALLFGMLSEFL